MSTASRPTPSMKFELRRCWKRWPRTYRPGDRRDAPVVADLARGVEDGQREPRVAAPVPGGPDDGGDAPRPQVEVVGRAAGDDRTGRYGVEHLRGQPGGVDVRVDAGEELAPALVDGGDGRREVAGEADVGPVDADEAPGQLDAGGLERGQVEVGVVGPADELQRRLAAGGGRVGHLVDGPVQAPDALEPPEDVHAAVAPRQPAVPADGQHDGSPGRGQLVGQLHARGRRADDEHAAVGQPAGVPVAGRHDLRDRRVECRGERGHGGLVAPARGHDDVSGVPRLVGGRHREAVAVEPEAEDGAVLGHGRGGRGRVVVEVGHDLPGRHEAVGVGTGVGPARQPAHPVRAEQPERVPALGPPALGDAAALEHDVVDAALGEAAAHGQAGLAGADDEGVGGAHESLQASRRPAAGGRRWGRRPLGGRAGQPASTSIDTGTPLVTTSNTAERWRDCSTTWRSFSGSSPRTLKRTVICW